MNRSWQTTFNQLKLSSFSWISWFWFYDTSNSSLPEQLVINLVSEHHFHSRSIDLGLTTSCSCCQLSVNGSVRIQNQSRSFLSLTLTLNTQNLSPTQQAQTKKNYACVQYYSESIPPPAPHSPLVPSITLWLIRFCAQVLFNAPINLDRPESRSMWSFWKPRGVLLLASH